MGSVRRCRLVEGVTDDPYPPLFLPPPAPLQGRMSPEHGETLDDNYCSKTYDTHTDENMAQPVVLRSRDRHGHHLLPEQRTKTYR